MSRMWWAVAGLLIGAPPLAAQDARLGSRFDARTTRAIEAVVAAATARGVPAEPLIQKALEGAAKGATGDAVERAVRALAGRLESAREQLGHGASDAELVAGASALYAGMRPAALGRLRALRPNGSLAMPLVALTFFVQRGVAGEASLAWIESIVNANIGTEELLRLQQSIETDVRSGAAPAAAAATRVEALLRTHGGRH